MSSSTSFAQVRLRSTSERCAGAPTLLRPQPTIFPSAQPLLPPRSAIQAYTHWLHKNHRHKVLEEEEEQPLMEMEPSGTEDFVTIGFVEMTDADEISHNALRNALLPSLANPRRALLVPVMLVSNNGGETRFEMSPPLPTPIHEDMFIKTASFVKSTPDKRGVVKPHCFKNRSPARGCMRYKRPYRKVARRASGDEEDMPTILPRGVYDDNTCTAWVFYAAPQPTEPLPALETMSLVPNEIALTDYDDYPAEVKKPREERGSNDTVISFLF
eukprot:scaffold226558_cov35-Tisochrysis_lutea.AAC.1